MCSLLMEKQNARGFEMNSEKDSKHLDALDQKLYRSITINITLEVIEKIKTDKNDERTIQQECTR